jgi:hypothetical protein
MKKVWDRKATRDWIAQLEHRIEDIRYYMERTIHWCEANGVYSDRTVFACIIMTSVWAVSYTHLRAHETG